MNKNTTNNQTVRFTVDFINKKIIGTKASFDKASKGFGPIYEELAAKLAKHPDFTPEVKEQKKHSTKAKKTYEGLDYKLMEDYIRIQANGIKVMRKYEAVKKFAKKAGKTVYPIVKKWFLDTYEDFDVNEAKEAICNALITNATDSVSDEKQTNSTEELKAAG